MAFDLEDILEELVAATQEMPVRRTQRQWTQAARLPALSGFIIQDVERRRAIKRERERQWRLTFPEKARLRARKLYQAIKADPERSQRLREYQRAYASRRRANPEYRKRTQDNQRKTRRERSADPERMEALRRYKREYYWRVERAKRHPHLGDARQPGLLRDAIADAPPPGKTLHASDEHHQGVSQ